jgi:hypothetical protein
MQQESRCQYTLSSPLARTVMSLMLTPQGWLMA